MTQTNGRGAAYRQNAAKTAQTYDVTLPSGAVFTLRAPNLEAFVLSGILPFELTLKLDQISRDADVTAGEAVLRLSAEEQAQSISFQQALLHGICVDPKIVVTAEADDEIAFTDLTADDLQFLVAWGMAGGSTAGDSFRRGQESADVVSLNRKERRAAAKRTA